MKNRELFGVCPEGEFFGRQREINFLIKRATDAHKLSPNVFLTGKRWIGKTEVLRRVHRDLFWEHGSVAPVYFQFRNNSTIEGFAEDYLKNVLKQYLAYRRRDSGVIKTEFTLDSLERLLADSDYFEAADFISRHREAKRSGDSITALRNALDVPHLLTLRSSLPVYLILDDMDALGGARGEGQAILEEVLEALGSGSFSFAVSSSRKGFLEGSLSGSLESVTLKGLDEDTAVSMMMDLGRKYGVETDSEILAFAANRLEGNPMYMKHIMWGAYRTGKGLTTLREFVDLYIGELVEGNIAFALRSAVRFKGANDLRVLNAAAMAGSTTEEEIASRFRYGAGELREIIGGIEASGLIEAGLGSVNWTGDNTVKDFVSFFHETRIKGRSPEEVRTALIREKLKEGFDLKGVRVSGRFREEVEAVVRKFNGQKASKALFNNRSFSARVGNGARIEDAGDEEMTLPQIVGSFDTARWERNETGPGILIAHGFQNGKYDSANEVVWIIAVKDALSPLNIGDVENFLRRSRILKENFRTTRIIRWMAGREGFTGEAQKRLESEGIFSTDAAQLSSLKNIAEEPHGKTGQRRSKSLIPPKEFEIVLPMSSKAELVAVKAAEEIGTEMGFDENAIGQIKGALVEACINAFEHSRLKNAKIFLRFIAETDRLVIHIENNAVEFEKPSAKAPSVSETGLPRKRGWGMELMKGLMDEVRFDKLATGVRTVLVKYLIVKEKGDEQA